MYLKAPFWSKDSNSESQADSPPSAVAELISSLERQRVYREVTLALRTGLSDARAEFSFLRIRGLRVILKFLRSVAESDTTINLFCHSQSIPDLQGFPPFSVPLGFLRLMIFRFLYAQSQQFMGI